MSIKRLLQNAFKRAVEQHDLKPCPFCGEQPNLLKVRDDRYVKGEMNWVIECKDMGCVFGRTSPNRSLNHLIARWNQRAGFWWFE